MEELKKLIEEVFQKGFASFEERSILVGKCVDLDTEEIDELKED